MVPSRNPHAFDSGGAWRHLLDARSDSARRLEVRAVFKQRYSDALTRAVKQTFWLVKTQGLLLGSRTGGSGECPCCSTLGLGQITETHEHRLIDCPLAELVWRHILQAWLTHCPNQPWLAWSPGAPMPRAARRAVILGLTPVPLERLRAAWTLLSAITLHEIMRNRNVLSVAQGGGARRHRRAAQAASVYLAVVAAFQSAVCEEHKRALSLRRQMCRAGLPASSYDGPHGPVANWQHLWVSTGVYDEHTHRQRLLPAMPPADVGLDAVARRRLAPCPDLAPPLIPPIGVRQCYVSATATTWSVVVLNGGDFERDEHAVHVTDAAGPVVTRCDHAGYRGVDTAHPSWDANPVLACALTAVCEALDMLMAPSGGAEQTPAVIRLPVGVIGADPALQILAGTCGPTVNSALFRAAHSRFEAAFHLTGGALYLAGWRGAARVAWGERAIALARLAADTAPPTCFGTPPIAWAGTPLAALPQVNGEECVVCCDAFSSMLPEPDPLSRSPPGRWVAPCPHALCRTCDAAVQASANPRCPLCRAPRAHFLLP